MKQDFHEREKTCCDLYHLHHVHHQNHSFLLGSSPPVARNTKSFTFPFNKSFCVFQQIFLYLSTNLFVSFNKSFCVSQQIFLHLSTYLFVSFNKSYCIFRAKIIFANLDSVATDSGSIQFSASVLCVPLVLIQVNYCQYLGKNMILCSLFTSISMKGENMIFSQNNLFTSISMKAKPGGFLATQTSETRPILWKASSMSNLSIHKPSDQIISQKLFHQPTFLLLLAFCHKTRT